MPYRTDKVETEYTYVHTSPLGLVSYQPTALDSFMSTGHFDNYLTLVSINVFSEVLLSDP